MDRDHLARLKGWFTEYCASFYTASEEDNRNIRLKEEHTHHVCANMTVLAESLALNEGEMIVADAVALFHDVGRFEQYRRYRTFKDSDSTNHAALGARVLADEGVLDDVGEEERRTIIRAVQLHNVFRVPDKLDERTLLFLKLIRDADKLDIWRVFIDFYDAPEAERASAVSLGFSDIPECSPEVIAALQRRELINLSILRTLNDFKLLQLSWVYDLNFAASLDLVAERGHVERIAATLPGDGDVEKAVKSVMDYVAGKMPGRAVGA